MRKKRTRKGVIWINAKKVRSVFRGKKENLYVREEWSKRKAERERGQRRFVDYYCSCLYGCMSWLQCTIRGKETECQSGGFRQFLVTFSWAKRNSTNVDCRVMISCVGPLLILRYTLLMPVLALPHLVARFAETFCMSETEFKLPWKPTRSSPHSFTPTSK